MRPDLIYEDFAEDAVEDGRVKVVTCRRRATISLTWRYRRRRAVLNLRLWASCRRAGAFHRVLLPCRRGAAPRSA